ncbi:MAG: hypothetical protein HY921_04650 [Elusimicrobia bacterium]|nr:hypothetical protein [Elusimicrobiota bacterium]
MVPVHEPDRALKSPPKKSGNGVFEILKTGFLMFWGTMFMAGLGAAFGPVGAIVGALAGATGAWLLKDRI